VVRFPSPLMIVALAALFLAVSLGAFVVAASKAAFSATGGNFILGQINNAANQSGIVSPVAGKMLLLNNTSTAATATALGLTVKPGQPPMVVNSTGKVQNLNADELDGYDSSDLATAAVTFRNSDSTVHPDLVIWNLNGLTPGQYLVTLSAGILPTTGMPAAPNIALCLVSGGEFFLGQSSPFTGDVVAFLSGADTLEVTPANASSFKVFCRVQTGSWRLVTPLQVSFVPLTSRTALALTPAAPRSPVSLAR